MSVYEYLEYDYLAVAYLKGFGFNPLNAQVSFKITKAEIGRTQFDQKIETSRHLYSQFQGRLEKLREIYSQFDQKVLSDQTFYNQVDLKLGKDQPLPSQLDQRIAGTIFPTHTQFQGRVESSDTRLVQVDYKISTEQQLKAQIDRLLSGFVKTLRMELSRGPISHVICGGYLLESYLTERYLVRDICAHMYSQVQYLLKKAVNIGMQVDLKINTSTAKHTQYQGRVESSYTLLTQMRRLSSFNFGVQLLISIYNTTNLRILYEFPSRGTTGLNWSVISGGTKPGDFNVNNVNNDLTEYAYRSQNLTATIQCDTQISQGIFNDTLAILGHNLTASASVTMQASNDPTFASPALIETLKVEPENIFWVSEFLPKNSYRYWRFIIIDTTNTDGYLQLGTIVFGPSVIFSGECFVDEVTRRKTHFADRIRTEGYSSVSNDRALKRSVSLTFRRLNFQKANYANLVDVVDTARTSLKCLWIPTPRYASRFAVFGKLAEIPAENHKVISETADYIDLDVTIDEAL